MSVFSKRTAARLELATDEGEFLLTLNQRSAVTNKRLMQALRQVTTATLASLAEMRAAKMNGIAPGGEASVMAAQVEMLTRARGVYRSLRALVDTRVGA